MMKEPDTLSPGLSFLMRLFRVNLAIAVQVAKWPSALGRCAMTRLFAELILIVVLSGFASRQPASRQLAASASVLVFELADVHASPPTPYPPYLHTGTLVGESYVMRQATMLDMISTAYGLDKKNVQGGPSWLDWDRFDVIAKAPPSTSDGALKLMLQSLLKDRFKLRVHEGSAFMPAYVLTAVKDPLSMKPSESPEEGDCKIESKDDALSDPSRFIQFSCRGETMDKFAKRLLRMAPDYVQEPVVNRTGLNRAWDFDLKWTKQDLLARAGSAGISIFDALDKQLGLKLVPGTSAAPALFVDGVSETPGANPPGLERSLPAPPPAHFEVTVVRPSRQDEKTRGDITGERLDLHAFTLKDLIDLSWNIRAGDSEALVGAPKWLDKTRFDIQGKFFIDTGGPSTQAIPQHDKDQVLQLLREILTDRFKMQAHIEQRPITAYTLAAVRPKLKVADPSGRTGCVAHYGSRPEENGPGLGNPAINQFVSCRNMTMAQFAEALRGWEFGYFFSPVRDATGLKGAWDLTLSFSSKDRFEAGIAPGTSPSNEQTTTSEPGSTLSLFDAIQRQLGMKLVQGKHIGPVLVIDHIDEQPTPN
jgi:uncharacterized protein (TIGR03435 family)